MLVEFKVENFRSIYARQALSMIASAHKKVQPHSFSSVFAPKVQLLPTAAIYGANASGKSNLILALAFVQTWVLHSAKMEQKERIPVMPFLFDEHSRKKPSEFHIAFSINKTFYQYGFAVDEHRIYEEWLSVYTTRRPRQWFFRQYQQKTQQYRWKFSKFFLGEKQFWADATQANALFLSTAVQLNNKQLLPIFQWFSQQLVIISDPAQLTPDMSIKKMYSTTDGKASVLQYLQIADRSIIDIKLNQLTSSNIHSTRLKCIHKNNTVFDFNEEASGTKSLFYLAGYWIDALEHGKTLVVDRLETNLHVLVLKHLLQLFSTIKKNKHHAQLIFSSQAVSLLDKEILCRDQIWFTEKDKDHTTMLYALLEFKPRNDQPIEKNYLLGRYGAIPFIEQG